jgi:hypothetical protein
LKNDVEATITFSYPYLLDPSEFTVHLWNHIPPTILEAEQLLRELPATYADVERLSKYAAPL